MRYCTCCLKFKFAESHGMSVRMRRNTFLLVAIHTKLRLRSCMPTCESEFMVLDLYLDIDLVRPAPTRHDAAWESAYQM